MDSKAGPATKNPSPWSPRLRIVCALLSVVALLSLLSCRSAAPKYTRIWEAVYLPPSSGFSLPGATEEQGEVVSIHLYESAEDLMLTAMFGVSLCDTDGAFVRSDWETLVIRVKCGGWVSGPPKRPEFIVTSTGPYPQLTYVVDITIPKGMKDDLLKQGILEMGTSRSFRLAFPNLPGAAPREPCDDHDLPLVHPCETVFGEVGDASWPPSALQP
jgi:hypothetical protein